MNPQIYEFEVAAMEREPDASHVARLCHELRDYEMLRKEVAFAHWQMEVARYFLSLGAAYAFAADQVLADPESWKSFFESGTSPEDAAREEMSCWDG